MASRFRAASVAVFISWVLFCEISGNTLISECNDANLRAAVSSGGVITFACDGIIELTNTIVVTKDVEIDGTGRAVTISGGAMHRLFAVTNSTFQLKNLSLVDGHSAGAHARYDHRTEQSFPAEDGAGGAVKAQGGSLIVEGCTFELNRATGGNGLLFGLNSSGSGLGGAILAVDGILKISDCKFLRNGSVSGTDFDSYVGSALGGAVAAIKADVQITGTMFVGNTNRSTVGMSVVTAAAAGGAVYLDNSHAVIRDSEFSRNTSLALGSRFQGVPANGGAIYSDGELEVKACTFQDNLAIGGAGRNKGGNGVGGAISSDGILRVEGSAFLRNEAQPGPGSTSGLVVFGPAGEAFGGALAAFGSTAVTNCTFAFNIASEAEFKDPASGHANGGAIYLDGSEAILAFLTLEGNSLVHFTGTTAPTIGAGIFATTNSMATIRGVLLGDHYLVTKTPYWYPPWDFEEPVTEVTSNIVGNIQDAGHNLSTGASGLTHATSLPNANPILGPLGIYGGTVPTIPLLKGSPAIDAGGTLNLPSADQRGRSRPYGAAADIGAYESSAPFFVAGNISGAGSESLVVAATALDTNTDASGNYFIDQFGAGPDVITPVSAEFVFEPNLQAVQVDADIAGVNFRAYRIGAWTWDFGLGENRSIVFVPATAGDFEIQSSTDLASWETVDTETLGERELHRMEISLSGDARFFQARSIP